MSFVGILTRPVVWGAVAAGLLALDAADLLDDAVGGAVQFAQTTMGDKAASPAAIEQTLLAAQDEARRYLPRYLAQAVRAPSDWDTRAVMVVLDPQQPQNAVWVENFQLAEGEDFEGVVTKAKAPGADAPSVETLSFSMDQIVDWAFVQNGTGFGYFTVRASLPYMPEAQAIVARNFLAETPLPTHW